MQMESVWVTGAGGLIGSYLAQQRPSHVPLVHALTRDKLDLRDATAVTQLFHTQKPDVVIHCAALSKSPDCHANPRLADELNVQVTSRLADLCASARLVFLSTDLVFDGQQGNYDESASVSPRSVYGETKVLAERRVLQYPQHLVIRTSLNGGVSPTHDRGFNEEMARAWMTGKTLTLFVDEFRSPIGAVVTARVIWELISRAASGGIYHVAGAERLSRWEIGQLLATRYAKLGPKLHPGTLREYQGAPRSPDTALNCAKAQQLLSFPLPRFSDWLPQQPTSTF